MVIYYLTLVRIDTYIHIYPLLFGWYVINNILFVCHSTVQNICSSLWLLTFAEESSLLCQNKYFLHIIVLQIAHTDEFASLTSFYC